MELRLRHLCAVALIVAAPLAEAASFDCTKATRAPERLICADATLSRLDEQVAAAYQEARAKLEAPGKDALQAGQKSWNVYWPRACSSDPKAVKFGSDAAACARKEHEERLKALRPTAGFDGKYTLHEVTLYAALTPEADSEATRAVLHLWSYPQLASGGLSGPDLDLARKVNAWLTPAPAEVDEAMKDDGAATETRTRLVVVSGNVLGAKTSGYLHGLGAPYPNVTSGARYFNRARQAPLAAQDVFKGEAWIPMLSKGAFSKLKARLGDGLMVENAGGLVEMVKSPRYWRFGKDGLTVDLDYEVAAHGAGPQKVLFPWAVLEPHLTDFGKAELASLR